MSQQLLDGLPLGLSNMVKIQYRNIFNQISILRQYCLDENLAWVPSEEGLNFPDVKKKDSFFMIKYLQPMTSLTADTLISDGENS